MAILLDRFPDVTGRDPTEELASLVSGLVNFRLGNFRLGDSESVLGSEVRVEVRVRRNGLVPLGICKGPPECEDLTVWIRHHPTFGGSFVLEMKLRFRV